MADAPLLAVENVSAFYGTAQALEDVSFEIAGGATSIVGRNGMGKTTLCNAIVGIPPARVTGSIRYRGTELVGQAVLQDREARDRLRAAGPASVPVALGRRAPADGRRARARGKRWTIERVYELFPRLAERRATAARSSRAASSRCSRSAARCSRTRRC